MFSSSYEKNVKIEICDFWLGKKLIQPLSSQELDISQNVFFTILHLLMLVSYYMMNY